MTQLDPDPTDPPDGEERKEGRMISFRIDGDMAQALDEHLVVSGMSQSDFVRSALVAYFSLYASMSGWWYAQVSPTSASSPERIVWWRRLIGAHHDPA